MSNRERCRVYWGTHGCNRLRGHYGHHKCDCCTCHNHPDTDSDGAICVGYYPYYGPNTRFYGEDVNAATDEASE